jgi:outer membrane protein assembly factor BamA
VRSILVLMLAAAAAGCASQAAAESAVTRTQEVQSVALDGERALPLAALRDVLATHRGDQLDADRLVRERSALESELEGRGYLAARVEPAVVTFAPSGGAYITFQINAGPVFKLRSVTVGGMRAAKDASVVTISTGDDALASRIESARQTLADNLGRRGKAANVTVALHTDMAAAAVDVELLSH